MRQLTVTAPRTLQWTDMPTPRLRDGRAALVEPVAIATCDFDHLMVSGKQRAPFPIAIGHELVARVIEVGDQVTRVQPGELVIVPFQISCGTCTACQRGFTSACASVPWLSCYGLGPAAGDWGGATADRIVVPFADAMLVALPAGVAARDAAPIGCNVVDAYRTVGPQLAAWPNAEVLIVGGAFRNIALYAVILARALGAARVDFLAHDRDLCDRAAKLGAHAVENAADLASMRYPITVDASMDMALLAAAVQATARAGVCTVSTMYAQPSSPLPMMSMFERCITLQTGQPHARALIDPVLTLLATGSVDLSPVVDAQVDWEDAPRAFGAGRGKLICTRVIPR